MIELEIDGVRYRLGAGMTEADTQALRAAFDRSRARFDSVSTETANLRTRAETAEKGLHEANEKLQRVSRYDAEDMDILSTAARIMGEGYSVEGKTPEEVMRDCVAKTYPNLSLEGKSADYIEGLFTAIPVPTTDAEEGEEMPKTDAEEELETATAEPPPENKDPTRMDSLRRVNRNLSGTAPRRDTAPSPRDAYLNEIRERGRKPLGAR